MADVYAGSTLNLAAATASDGTMGCFENRDVNNMALNYVDVSTGSCTESWRLGVSKEESAFINWGNSMHIQQSPLYKRAWALQELLLPRRVLYFCDGQIMWSCQKGFVSEQYPERYLCDDSHLGQLRSCAFVEPSPSSVGTGEHHQPQFWKRLVETYSRSELTFPSKDKLVAISGLAKQYESPEGYLVGIWKRHLGHQLLWRVKRDKEAPAPTKRLALPSWTWAAVDNEISFPEVDVEDTSQELKLLEDRIVTPAEDRTGHVIVGHLQIEASLACATFGLGDYPRSIFQYLNSAAIDSSPAEISTNPTVQLLEKQNSSSVISVKASISWDEIHDHGDGELIYCLLTYRSHSENFGTSDGLTILPSSRTGFYRRLGTFRVWGEEEKKFHEIFHNCIPYFNEHPELYENKAKLISPTSLPRYVIWLE
ncbi:MAG: hypothetical protein Q9227_008798 [Pyrenula ochraceoflavens]